VEMLSEQTALTVNGEPTTLGELLTVARWREQLQFLDAAVEAALIRQAAAEEGLEVSEEELQQAANAFRTERSLHSATATRAWLDARGLTMAQWEQGLTQEILRAKLRERLIAPKVEPHFAEHRFAYDTATLSRIVASAEGITRELRAQVVEEGADFHALSRRYSEDAETRPAGGYLGEIRRKQLEATLQASVFGAKPGQVVGPFRIEKRWHLLLVEALHPATLDEPTRETIAEQLFAEWLQARRDSAEITLPLLQG
jgi:putative peptide maturation system protein